MMAVRISDIKHKPIFCVVLFILVIMLFIAYDMAKDMTLSQNCPYVWHGGSPSGSHRGSCWCGDDNYCMCTPSLAIDCIIEYEDNIDTIILHVYTYTIYLFMYC